MNTRNLILPWEEPEKGENSTIWKHIERTNGKINMLISPADSEKLIRRELDTFLRFWRQKISKWLTIESLEEILSFIDGIFDKYDIKKLYNFSTPEEVRETYKKNIYQIFASNIVFHKKDHSLIDSSFWWSCYDWTILLYKIFQEIDPKDNISKKIIYFTSSLWHAGLFITFQWQSYIIDLFAKEAGKIVKVLPWSMVYSGVIRGNNTFGIIENTDPLKITDKEGNSIRHHLDTIDSINFLEKNRRIILQIKTYLNWNAIELQISDIWTHYGIYFLGNIIKIPKNSFITSIKNISKKGDISSFEIMEEILGVLNEPFRSYLRYVCEKIPPEKFLNLE